MKHQFSQFQLHNIYEFLCSSSSGSCSLYFLFWVGGKDWMSSCTNRSQVNNLSTSTAYMQSTDFEQQVSLSFQLIAILMPCQKIFIWMSKIVAGSAFGIMFLLLLKIKGFTLQQKAVKIECHFLSFVLFCFFVFFVFFFPYLQSFIMLVGGFIFLDVNNNCNEVWFIPEETVSHKIFKC